MERAPEQDPEGSRVRVMGAPPAETTDPASGGLMLLVGFAAIMVMALWLTGGSNGPTPTDADAPSLTAASLVERTMPDLGGLTIEEAAARLQGVGLESMRSQMVVRWEASEARPVGTIVRQTPPAGAPVVAPVAMTLTVSEGGPVVSFADLPDEVRSLARTLTGFDPDTLFVASDTPAGPAYKTDDWLIGDCAAVELSSASFADSSFTEECFTTETMSLGGVLVDGTPYRIWGLPVADYPEPVPGGGIVFESGRGTSALGASTYHPTSEMAAARIGFDGRVLSFAAGTWRGEVELYPGVIQQLGEMDTELTDLVHVRDVAGSLVVQLAPPLRWPAPGELLQRITADYGSFVVAAGCPGHSEGVVCDPSGSVSIEAHAPGFDLSRLAIRVGAGDGTRHMIDPLLGMEWRVPTGWELAPGRLTSINFPREAFSAGTYPLRIGGTQCSDVPERALVDLGPEDVLVTLYLGGDAAERWPRPFSLDALTSGGDPLGIDRCLELAGVDLTGVDVRTGSLVLDDVPFQVLVALGDNVAPQEAAAAERLLDSVVVDPVMWVAP